MSITTAIERIQNSVEDIKNSIENKGVTVPAGSKVDDLADLVDQIQQGSTIRNQNKTVDTSTNIQIVSADTGYTGLGTVTVNPAEYQDKTVDASTGTIVVRPDTSSGELTAIVSDGNTAFNSGITIDGTHRYKYEVKYYWPGYNGSLAAIIGADEDETEQMEVRYTTQWTSGGTKVILELEYSDYPANATYDENVGIHTVSMNCDVLGDISQGKVTYTVDGNSIQLTEKTTGMDAGTLIGIFCEMQGGRCGDICPLNTRIYYFKLWINGVLSYDFEPAYHNGQYCFHDIVHDTYIYAVQGTPTGCYDKGYDALSSVTINGLDLDACYNLAASI